MKLHLTVRLAVAVLGIFTSASQVMSFFVASWAEQFKIGFTHILAVAITMMQFNNLGIFLISTSLTSTAAFFHQVLAPSLHCAVFMRCLAKSFVIRVVLGIIKVTVFGTGVSLGFFFICKLMAPSWIARAMHGLEMTWLRTESNRKSFFLQTKQARRGNVELASTCFTGKEISMSLPFRFAKL